MTKPHADKPPNFRFKCPRCYQGCTVRGQDVQQLWDAAYVRADGRAWEAGPVARSRRDGADGNRPCQPVPVVNGTCGNCKGAIVVGLAIFASADVHLPMPVAADSSMPVLRPVWHGPVRRILVLGWPDEVSEPVKHALARAAGDLPVGQCEIAHWPSANWRGVVKKWAEGRGYTLRSPELGAGVGPRNRRFLADWQPDVIVVAGSPPLWMSVKKATATMRTIRCVQALADNAEVVAVAAPLRLIEGGQ